MKRNFLSVSKRVRSASSIVSGATDTTFNMSKNMNNVSLLNQSNNLVNGSNISHINNQSGSAFSINLLLNNSSNKSTIKVTKPLIPKLNTNVLKNLMI